MNDQFLRLPLLTTAYIFSILVAVIFGSLLYFGTMYLYVSLRNLYKREQITYGLSDLVSKTFFKRELKSVNGVFHQRFFNVVGSIKKNHLVGYITTITIIFIMGNPSNLLTFNVGIKEMNIYELIAEFILPCEFILWLILLCLSAVIVKED